MRSGFLAIAVVVIGGSVWAEQAFTGLTKITMKRIPMAREVAIMCSSPSRLVGPHLSPEVDVFVNETVLAYRRAFPEKYDYPVGSTFVKKKYAGAAMVEPYMATVMVRRAKTGSVDDWEFSMMSLPDNKPLPMDGPVSCASCHNGFAKRGFISAESEGALRGYLGSPPESVMQLRPEDGAGIDGGGLRLR